MRSSLVSIVLMVVVSWVQAATPGEPFALTDSLGSEIDASEQEGYHLFPDVEGFVSAHLTRTPKGDFRLHYTVGEPARLRTRAIPVAPSVVEHTRIHAHLVERYWAARRAPLEEVGEPLPCVERACLLLASRGEYDAAHRLVSAAINEGTTADALVELRDTFRGLATARGLFLPGSLYDQSGRTELLVFSGYYGLWLGIATPIIARANSAAEYGLPLLVIPTASLFLASQATKHAQISDGRAGMISLGGHLGTWQGIGWAGAGDRTGRQVVAAGTAAGLVGIGAATVLTGTADLTPGHAEIANSGLPWGAWLGAVAGVLADHDGDQVLRDMLIGSDIAVSAGLLAGRGSPVSRARVRVCNMAGVLGGIAGFGIALIAQVSDEDPAIALAAAGSLGGVYAGIRATRKMDTTQRAAYSLGSSEDRGAASVSLTPRLSVHTLSTSRRPAPAVEVAIRF